MRAPGRTRQDAVESVEVERELLARAGSSDREAAAELVAAYEPIIRSRFRGYFGDASPSLVDSSDFFITVMRRLDETVACPTTTPESDELLGRLQRIMLSAISDYVRESHRSPETPRPREQELSEEPMLPKADLSRALQRLGAVDRDIAWLRLRGIGHAAIASTLKLSTTAVRMRWMRIRRDLRATFAAG